MLCLEGLDAAQLIKPTLLPISLPPKGRVKSHIGQAPHVEALPKKIVPKWAKRRLWLFLSGKILGSSHIVSLCLSLSVVRQKIWGLYNILPSEVGKLGATAVKDRYLSAVSSGWNELDWSAIGLKVSQDAGSDVSAHLKRLAAGPKTSDC